MMVFAIGCFAFVVTVIVGGALRRLGLPHTLAGFVWTIAVIAVAGALVFSLPGPQTADGPWPYYFATVGGAVLAACLLTLMARRHPPVQ